MTETHKDDVVLSDEFENDDTPETEAGESTTIDLYDANLGKAPRTGGVYLDELTKEQAEIRRAKVEDREPDLDNPPATAATQLVPKEYLRETDTDKSHFSDRVELENDPVDSYEYTPPVHEQDKKQVDWNNDRSIVDAAQAKVALQQAEKDKDDDEPSEEQKIVLESEAARAADEASKYRTPNSDSSDEAEIRDPDPNLESETDEELFGANEPKTKEEQDLLDENRNA